MAVLGEAYTTSTISGTLADSGNGYGFVFQNYPTNGVQNGSPDGVALVKPDDTVVQFLSSEGTFLAVGGLANGLVSTDIGVAETNSTLPGQSLQLTGVGDSYYDFIRQQSILPRKRNECREFFGTPIFINEIHYDDDTGTGDINEGIEIAGPAGTDLTNWKIILYNGSNGSVYTTTLLSGILPNSGNGYGFVYQSYPTNGVQNGSPDGVALVKPDNSVVQLFPVKDAVGGPANGLISTDIGVSEASTTPAGITST